MFDLFAAAFEFTARVPRSVTSHQSKMKVLGLMSNIDSESGSNIDLPVRVAEVFEYEVEKLNTLQQKLLILGQPIVPLQVETTLTQS